ncbi:MAG: glycosyltransferase family 4 protein [bacterium]
MVKVLLVVSNSILNGTERCVINIAKSLNNENFEIWVATPEQGQLSDILKEYSIKEFVYNNGKIGKFSFHGSKNLYKFIKEKKFDIVHANSGIIPCVIGKLLGVKLCLETKHGLFFSQKELENISFKHKIYEKIKEYFVNYFVVVSDNDRERLIKFFNIKERKIKVIYYGIDLKKLEPFIKEKSKFKKEKSVIGNIGRLTYQKGQDILIKSFLKLLSLEKNVELIIIGDGEDEQMLKNIIHENNLEEFIKIINYKKNIFEYFSSFDIFVLTSRFEGIPFVLYESMKLGIPVISTEVGGINKIIQNDYNGILIEVDNIDQTTNAMKRLISDKELYCKMRKNAIDSVEKYGLQNMVKEYENLYHQFLKNQRAEVKFQTN